MAAPAIRSESYNCDNHTWLVVFEVVMHLSNISNNTEFVRRLQSHHILGVEERWDPQVLSNIKRLQKETTTYKTKYGSNYWYKHSMTSFNRIFPAFIGSNMLYMMQIKVRLTLFFHDSDLYIGHTSLQGSYAD